MTEKEERLYAVLTRNSRRKESVSMQQSVRTHKGSTDTLDPKLQTLVYDILPSTTLEEGAGRRCSECGSICARLSSRRVSQRPGVPA